MTGAILATQFRIWYDVGEDRLAIHAGQAGGDSAAVLMLTRRLTVKLINGFGALLQASSIFAHSAPEELVSDIILLEHQGALVDGGRDSTSLPVGTGHSSTHLAAILVTDIAVTTRPSDFMIVFLRLQRPLVQIVVSRSALHRLLDALKRHADEAGWNMPIEVNWLSPTQAMMVIN